MGVVVALWAEPAMAHVKWFAPYDVPTQPRVLSDLLNYDFWQPVSLAVLALVVTCYLERTAVGRAMLAAFDRIGGLIFPRIDDLYRAGTGAFFVALGVMGTIILTPELKTAVPAIRWFDIAVAIGMFWRPTMVLSALGIVAFYAYGVAEYGIFHMLDYPIFLGLAAYLGLSGLRRNFLGLRPLDVARWAAGITLIWASVEKWAYPEWTYPLLKTHANLAMGFYPGYYMDAAGVVEFSLAFGLLWTPLVRRLSALVLTAMFISAVIPFGIIDAVGHSMIIVILIGILADTEPIFAKSPVEAVLYYAAALAMILAAYYGLHALIFGTLIW